MFKNFIKILNKVNTRHDEQGINEFPQKEYQLSKKLDINLSILEEVFSGSNDVIMRRFSFGQTKTEAALISIDGLIDTALQASDIIKPLMYDGTENAAPPSKISDIEKKFLIAAETKKADTIGDICTAILNGDSALLVDGIRETLLINTKGFAKRSIEDPQTESILRGSREAFNEVMRTNTALIRRRIKDHALVAESVKLGKKTNTTVTILYLRNVANKELINEVKARLGTIDTDAIFDSGSVEQFISDKGSWLFPTIGNTEKPDVAAAKILEGRVAIVVDGSPYVLTAPMYFIENFQTSEDYNIAPIFAIVLRFTRLLAFSISLLIMPLYVALITFHQELLPTKFLFTTAVAEAGTPFPAVIEGLLMIAIFEILKEAGIRLPRPAGQAVSMVGAIIIGDTAVSAGIIGAPLVIFVALTSVAAFAVPTLSNASTVLRIFLLFLAGFIGGYGITLGLLFVISHLTSLRSFGTPYLSPFSPFRVPDLKDSLVKLPLKDLITRPLYLSRKNPKRQKE